MTTAVPTQTLRETTQKVSTSGQIYTDIVVSCLLDYGEPATQAAFDNTSNQ